MIFEFDTFSLDMDRFELTDKNGAVVPMEPQVFELLALLVRNGDRVTTRDEILSEVCNGRIVSDAAIASLINAVRAAIGADGK